MTVERTSPQGCLLASTSPAHRNLEQTCQQLGASSQVEVTLSCSLGRGKGFSCGCLVGCQSFRFLCTASARSLHVSGQLLVQTVSSKVQSPGHRCSLQLALRAGRGHLRSELSAESRKGRSRAAEQWGSRGQERWLLPRDIWAVPQLTPGACVSSRNTAQR